MAGSNLPTVIIRAAGIVAACALAAACGGSPTSPIGTPTDSTKTTPTVASVAVTPAVDSLVPQQTVQLTAAPRDASGNTISGQTISWNATPASVATISAAGVVTAVATGSATVTATTGSQHGTATITVSDGGVVDASGATVATASGVAALLIPAHALGASTLISIASMPAPPAAPQLVPGTAFNFGPTGTQFAQPVTIDLRYTPAQVPAGVDPSQLRLYLLNGTSWTLVAGSSVDTAAHVVSGTTTHFSGYAACAGLCGGTAPAINIGFTSPGATLSAGTSVTNHGGTIATRAYSGLITFTVTGAPAGVTTTITQDTVAGTPGFALQVTAAASVAAGDYTLTVTGSGVAGSNATPGTVQFPLIVLGTVSVRLDFSGCDPRVLPVWVAYQDGTAPVTQVTGTANVYNFAISSAKGAVMIVTPTYTGAGFGTAVYYGMAGELGGMPACGFVPPAAGKTLLFTEVDGVNALTQGTNLSMPNGTTLSIAADVLNNVIPGVQDFLGFRYNMAIPTTEVRGVIERGINLPAGGSIGIIDFNGSASFAPAAGTFTVNNVNGETLLAQIRYLSEPNVCDNATYFMGANPADTGTSVFGVPVSSQLPADVHLAAASTATRTTDVWFHTFASQITSLGAMLPVPVIQQQAGQYKRPLVSLTLPSDYSVLNYSWSGGNNGLMLEGTTGYTGGNMMALAMPDVTTLPGYSTNWASNFSQSGTYVLTGMNAPVETCTDGTTFRRVRATGNN
jgi:hypothetical protein